MKAVRALKAAVLEQAKEQAERLAELAARINAEHAASEAAVKRSLEHALAAGEALIEAKSTLAHGEWGRWLEGNCTCSERSARVYMQLARHKSVFCDENGSAAEMSIRRAAELVTESQQTIITAWKGPDRPLLTHDPHGAALRAVPVGVLHASKSGGPLRVAAVKALPNETHTLSAVSTVVYSGLAEVNAKRIASALLEAAGTTTPERVARLLGSRGEEPLQAAIAFLKEVLAKARKPSNLF